MSVLPTVKLLVENTPSFVMLIHLELHLLRFWLQKNQVWSKSNQSCQHCFMPSTLTSLIRC